MRKHQIELGIPWTDPTFPASETSIGISKMKTLPSKIIWKRPNELTNNPFFILDDMKSTDVIQGRLGNCWFVAAASVLAGSKTLREKVIPESDKQSFSSELYSGIFRFHFWIFGVWTEILIDDLLPTSEGFLIFCHSPSHSEFWGPLLEKAYAKLYGSYGSLDGGNLSDALVDFTSGITEVIKLDENSHKDELDYKKKFFKSLSFEMEEHSLMTAAIKPNSSSEMLERTTLGLIKGHAYGITSLKRIPIGHTNLVTLFKGREKLNLIRLQNPWGEKEWCGPFSDKSSEWSSISEKEREKLGITFEDDGDFWMTFDDFLTQFSEMSICRLINTSYFSFSKSWEEKLIFGEWRGVSAGGCLNHLSFCNNPQIRFNIGKDEDEAIFQLSQKDTRYNKDVDSEMNNYVIGLHIMKVEENRVFRLHSKLRVETKTSDYIQTKHVFYKGKFLKGRYILLPTTYNPGEEREFLLRIFTNKDAQVQQLKYEHPVKKWWSCSEAPTWMTRIKEIRLENLETSSEGFGGGKVDPYIIIKAEGQVVQTPVKINTTEGHWDFPAIFYLKHFDKPVQIQLWNHNTLIDSFMGQCFLQLKSEIEDKKEILPLFGRRTQKTKAFPGSLSITYETTNDLLAF